VESEVSQQFKRLQKPQELTSSVAEVWSEIAVSVTIGIQTEGDTSKLLWDWNEKEDKERGKRIIRLATTQQGSMKLKENTFRCLYL
jgi:hypothetical protein